MKIHKIDYTGQPVFQPLYAQNYHILQEEYRYHHNLILPTVSDLDLFENRDWRMLVGPLTISVSVDNAVYIYNFIPGHITDLASVPASLRSLVDNDDRRVMWAALLHDVNYGLHLMEFNYANLLFFKMIIAEAAPLRKMHRGIHKAWERFKSWSLATKAYIAVSSPLGRAIYNHKTDIKNLPLRNHMARTVTTRFIRSHNVEEKNQKS